MCSDADEATVLALGPLEVRWKDRAWPIGSAPQRGLLARLLTADGRPVSVDRLCDELWGEDAPRDPLHALQARVSRLRSALPGLTIEQAGNGYRLETRRVHTDIAQFERLRDAAVRLLAGGALEPAADRLHEALELWRGPAFADVPSVPAIRAEAARLQKLWVSATADRIDIDLAMGREAAVIPELAAIVEEHVLHERFWGQLMVALYRQDHVQEALDAYARARDVFSERFGVEPNGALGTLHVRILQGAPAHSLLRFPPTARAAMQPAAPYVPEVAQDAPVTSNGAERLAVLLQQRQAVIVTGPAGIGKTHLLRSVRAHLEAQHYAVPLLSASALSQTIPLGVFAGIADALAEEAGSAPEVVAAIARHRSTTAVLVDNIDMLDDASLFVVQQLITTAHVPVLIAARALTEAPEAIRALYDSGALVEVAVDRLDDDEAETLSVAIAGGSLTPDTRIRILEAAAGLPLRLREIITGSKAAGRLAHTAFGWELRGDPSPSPRLAQLTGERLAALDPASLEALSLVAIAGELPPAALEPSQRRVLARADVLALSDGGWLRLRDPMDREVLRARCSDVLWHDLTREAVRLLSGGLAADVPQARHRAHLLALGLGEPVDAPATVALAARALGAFDERLALTAAMAVIAQDAEHGEAHRVAGAAASVLRMPEAAEAHFDQAYRHSRSPMERAAVALEHARHRGLRLHDVDGARQIIERASSGMTCERSLAQLGRARQRWTSLAGGRAEVAPSGEPTADAAGVMGLIEAGMSAVITGPLQDARRVLRALQRMPVEAIALVPGGEAMIVLIETMALSYSGDLASTRRMLRRQIEWARERAPHSLGDWEYALGITELLSGDATRAHALAVAAVEHLEWRDSTGLLPAALALRAASGAETGHPDFAPPVPDGVPEAAAGDPKVVLLRRWAAARQLRADGRGADAARQLVETAKWLLAAQHSYFAGMCAHYAVRTGHELEGAVEVLADAHAVAGGGMLHLLLRHGEATLAGDHPELDRIAGEASELGLWATAADTWARVLEHAGEDPRADRAWRLRAAIGRLAAAAPAVSSWTT